uniref:Putative secreted protein n=1 Tax=Ixodes ricinus TaxID=34613 RepID=A0A6B0TU56_IXORI
MAGRVPSAARHSRATPMSCCSACVPGATGRATLQPPNLTRSTRTSFPDRSAASASSSAWLSTPPAFPSCRD